MCEKLLNLIHTFYPTTILILQNRRSIFHKITQLTKMTKNLNL